jgi:hypothetical protein
MKLLLALFILSSVSVPAHAFDVDDALQIVTTLSGVVNTMNRPKPLPEQRPSLDDQLSDINNYDLECRLRGFDGWYDNKCQNLYED